MNSDNLNNVSADEAVENPVITEEKENTEELVADIVISEVLAAEVPKSPKYECKVSIVMPVYNADDYLVPAMDTVLAQTLEDFELICVDDGSTDKSLEILNSYAERDSRVTVLTMNHIGVGTARNKGLLKTRGEYVIFLDADDFYEPDLLEKMYNTAKENNLDIVATGFDLYDNKKARFLKSPEEEHGNIYAGGAVASKNEYPDFILQSTTGYVWNKLFRTSFIKEKEIVFAPELYVFEDVYFVCCALSLAERVSRIYETLVHHRIYHEQQRAKLFRKHYNQVPVVYLKVKEFLMRHGMYIPLSKSFLNFSASRCYKIFNLISGDRKDDFWDLLHHGYADSLGWYRHEVHDFENHEVYDFVANIGLYTYDEYAKLKLKGKLQRIENMTLNVLKKKIKQLQAKARVRERLKSLKDKIKKLWNKIFGKKEDENTENPD